MFRHTIPTHIRQSFFRFWIYIILGILLFCGGNTLAQAAAPVQIAAQTAAQTAAQSPIQVERFPRRIANPVRRDLADRLKLPRQQLTIASATFDTWTDDCLGLNAPGELCIQIPIEGWRVEVTNGHRSWFYRTDLNGRNIRLESEIGAISLPPQIGDRILSLSSTQLGIPTSQLTIAQSQQHWESCPALAIGCSDLPGWRVIIIGDLANSATKSLKEDSFNSWIYRANGNGSEIYLDEAVSQNTSLIPTFLPTYGNPTQLGESVIFRTVASGGFSHQTYETILRNDGRVVRSLFRPGASMSQLQSYKISLPEVEAFQQLLRQQQFSNFDGLNYSGEATLAVSTKQPESVTITLIGQNGMTQYRSTVEDQLPPALLEIVQSLDRLVG
jgi:hypothetical protein